MADPIEVDTDETITLHFFTLVGWDAGPGLRAGSGRSDCLRARGPIQPTPFYNNITTQATYWVLNYQINGVLRVSIEFDSATGVSAPGAFGLFSGTVTTGSNPMTSVSCATPTNCTAVFTGSVGFARVAFTSYTGLGTIRGTLQGYKTGYALGGNMTGGSGCPTPCPVKGVDSSGSPPTVAPVPAAGFDGTNIQPIKTDTGGNLQTAPIGAAAFTTNQVAVTGTAAMIDAGTAARAVCVEALAGKHDQRVCGRGRGDDQHGA